jgi:phosphate:Na+ symporter
MILGISFAFGILKPEVFAGSGETASNSDAAQSDEETSELFKLYQQERSNIAPNDAEAHYQLGMSMYLKHSGKGRDLEPLQLAAKEFKTASGIFNVTLKNGSQTTYNASNDDKATDAIWQQIATDYKPALEDCYQQIHAKDKDSDKRTRSVEDFDKANHREVLAKVASNFKKVVAKFEGSTDKPDYEKLNVFPCEVSYPQAAKLYKVASSELKSAEAAMNPSILLMAFSVIGGLGIFLIGMKHMSDGIQAVAGAKLRRMINAVTDNRFMAVGVGTGVTCFVQSSSITTVIVVGLVNSGLMVLHQAIGVIMGANIGTTITGWILALKIGKYGLPILGVSAFFYLFTKKDRIRYIAMALLGLGMIFFGLEMMKNGFKPMKYVPAFEEAFAWFDASTYIGVLQCAAAGCILTFLVQSSSATLGITIGLAATGAIPFETAGALVLGENIGTTITAWLASIGATTSAKRAAYAHVLFNLIGVFWITLIYSWLYVDMIGALVEYTQGVNPVGLNYEEFANKGTYAVIVTVGIASVHTCFNLTNTLIFLPFVRHFANLLERFLPDKAVKEVPHLAALDIRMAESPILAIENSRGEVIKMAHGCHKMMDWMAEIVKQSDPDQALQEKIFHREKIMDSVQSEVISFVTSLMSGEVPLSVTVEGRQQIRIADEYESISDYISNVLKSRLRLVQNNLTLPDSEVQGLDELHEKVTQYIILVTTGFENNQGDILPRAETQGKSITKFAKELRDAHLVRLEKARIEPVENMSFMAIINGYRKIKDHALNIAEAMANQ